MSRELKQIPLSAISGGNYRPENAEHIRALADKIRAEGFRADLYGAIVVTDLGDDRYQLESGFHRVAACRMVFEPDYLITAAVIPFVSAAESLYHQLDGNNHRLDAPAYSEGAAFAKLIQEGQTIDEIANRMHRTKAYVMRRLQVNELDESVQPIICRLGFVWGDSLLGLPHAVQRALARVLEGSEMTRPQWVALCHQARQDQAKRDEQSLFDAEDFALAVQEWSVDAERYVLGSQMDLPELVGPRELAEALGVKTLTVRQWRFRGQLPEPLAVVSDMPLWDRATMQEFITDKLAARTKVGAGKTL